MRPNLGSKMENGILVLFWSAAQERELNKNKPMKIPGFKNMDQLKAKMQYEEVKVGKNDNNKLIPRTPGEELSQEDIIQSVLNGRDTVALLPTGGGKSVCFQIPALIKPGICIVISPLVALMQDQVNTLKQKGIKAMSISAGVSYSDLDTQLDNCIYGNYKFLY